VALPGGLTTTTVTGEFVTPTGRAMVGTVTFTPSATLGDPTGTAIIPAIGTTYPLSSSGTFETDPLVATDNTELQPTGWTYNVLVALQDVQPYSFAAFLPSSPSTVDLSALEPVYPAGTVLGPAGTYLPSGGGSETGTLVLDASPPLKVPGATSGQILMSDSSGNFTPQADVATNATAIDGVTVTGTVASGRTIIATSSSAATWQLPLQIDTTATDIKQLGSRSAGSLLQAAAADHIHPTTGLVQIDGTAADIQPSGIRSAGSAGLAADAGHVHPGNGSLSLYAAPSGATAETYPWPHCNGTSTPVSGRLQAMAIGLPAGLAVSNLTFGVGGTAASGLSHGWYVLLDSGGIARAVSADQTSGTWGSTNALATLAMSAYTTTYSGLYYAGWMVAASQVPLMTVTSPSGILGGAMTGPPVLCGVAGSGLTTPPAVGTQFTLGANGFWALYAYTS
jgi:hypothetical protein